MEETLNAGEAAVLDVLKGGETEARGESQGEQQSAQEQETASEQPSEVNVELERLRRAVASDPALRSKYEQELYADLGVSPELPNTMPAQSQMAQEAAIDFAQFFAEPQLPFNPEEFDPSNVEHHYALMNIAMQQQMKPFAAYIQKQMQMEQVFQQQQQQQKVQELETRLQDTLDNLVPGLKDSIGSKNPTFEQKLFNQASMQLFAETMQQFYPQTLWQHPKVLDEVAARIAPELKKIASRFGLLKEAGTESQAVYVEPNSTTALPASGKANPFDEAAAQGDLYGMLMASKKSL